MKGSRPIPDGCFRAAGGLRLSTSGTPGAHSWDACVAATESSVRGEEKGSRPLLCGGFQAGRTRSLSALETAYP